MSDSENLIIIIISSSNSSGREKTFFGMRSPVMI